MVESVYTGPGNRKGRVGRIRGPWLSDDYGDKKSVRIKIHKFKNAE